MSPEEAQYLEQEREGLGRDVQVVQTLHDEETTPFAGNRIATIRPDGTIEIAAPVFKSWLSGIRAGNRRAAVRALLAEESNHQIVRERTTPEERAGFWNNLTAAEQSMFTRIYTGEWNLEAANRRHGTNLTPELMGFEAINHFQMRFGKMTPRETVEAMGREKITVQTLEALSNILYKARRALGTEASGMQAALLDKVLFNIQVAKAAVAAGPGALNKRNINKEEASNVIGEVNLMGAEEFAKFTAQLANGMTHASEDLGMSLTKPEQLQAMYAARELAHEQQRAAVKSGDVDAMMAYGFKHQFFGEAIDAATGGGATGDWLKKNEPGYKPPFPEAAGEFGPGALSKSAGREATLADYKDIGARFFEKYPKKHPVRILAAHDNRSAHVALKALLDSKAFNRMPAGFRELADQLWKFGDKGIVFRMPKETPEGSEMMAVYSLDDHEIRFPDRDFTSFLHKHSGITATQTFLHEYVHGLTSRVIEDEGYPRELTWLMDKTRTWLNENVPDAETHWNTKYALKDPHEFLAQAFSSPQFQDVLKKIEATDVYKGRSVVSNLWDKFVAMVGKLLGFEDHQALSDVIKIGLGLASKSKAEQFKQPGLFGEDFPSALRKDKGRGTPEMFMPPLAPGQPRQSDSPFKTPTAFQFEKMASDYMWQAESPSFKDFVAEARRTPEFGANIKPGMLVDIWQGAVYRRLLNAAGEVLEKLRGDLGLTRQYGERNIADPPPRERYALEQQTSAEARKTLRDEQKTIKARQNYRRTMIRAIADRLIAPALEDTSHLGRKEITADDLGLANKTKQPVVNDIPRRNTSDADYLERVLTEDARQNLKKVSETNRVTVAQNKTTGEVYLLSTYKDGRRGVLLKNPKGEGQLPLRKLLENYRVVSSLFLDRPVKDFAQRFETLAEYEDKLGGEARSASRRAIGEPTPPEGEFAGRGPTTGRYATPGVFQAEPGIASELAGGKAPDITNAEAGAILDHLIDEVDKVESPRDVLDAIEGLNYSAAQNALTGRDWTAIAGYAKVYDSIRAKWPQLTPEQVFDQMVDEIYDKAANAETSTGFQSEVISDYSRPVPETTRRLPIGPSLAPRLPSAPVELQMRSRIPPTVDPNVQIPAGPGPAPSPVGGRPPTTPAALNKWAKGQKQIADDLWLRTKGAFAAAVKRRKTMEDIPRLLDAGERSGEHFSAGAGSAIRLASGQPLMVQGRPPQAFLVDPIAAFTQRMARAEERKEMVTEAEKRRGAAIAVIATGSTDAKGNWRSNQHFLTDLHNFVSAARTRAYSLARDVDPRKRVIGRAYEKYVEQLQETVDYADKHWKDPELVRTVETVRRELHEEIDFENKNGLTVEERENYVPNRYEGAFWHDNGITWGAAKLFGTAFRARRTFKNIYEAAAAGPYISASLDIADLAQHRITQGRRSAMRNAWLEDLKAMRDPDSHEPIAKDPAFYIVEEQLVDPKTGQTYTKEVPHYKSPDPMNYKLVRATPESKPIAIRMAYAKLIKTLLQPSVITEAPLGEAAMIGAGMLKHGVLLIIDTFHLGRLTEYAAALLGKQTGFRGGYSVLHYRPADLAEAVRQGYISQKSADWALEPVTITSPRGGTTTMTNHELASEAIKTGLNATKITDALYKDVVRRIPIVGEPWWKVIGPYNRFLFDRYVPGLIIETAVRNIAEYNRKNPNIPINRIIKDVVKDTNIFYGNLGRQGFFKSATWRDFNQILFLAPQWVEGLLQKEIRFYSRLTGLSALTGRRGVPYWGTLGKGMGRGLLGFLALTQMINIATRGKPTWKNEEKGHELDAWIPTGKEGGYWLSPMAVFSEVLHDVLRLSESKPTNADAWMQIVGNKLGPVGKMLAIAYTGTSPTGEKYSTTAGRVKGALGQLTPAPIALGTPVRYAASKIAPETVSPPRKGMLGRQMLASFGGLKVQAGQTPLQEIGRLAADFKKRNNLDRGTLSFIPTDEASLAKLRAAVRNDDIPGARAILKGLREKRNDNEISKAMEVWARKPITGSQQNEGWFLSELTPEQLEIHNRAMIQKMEDNLKVQEFLLREP